VLHGKHASPALRCRAGIRARIGKRSGSRPAACRAMRHGFQSCGKDICTGGPVEWKTQNTGVVLFYGTLGDDPTRYRTQSVPQLDQPYVSITQSTDSTDSGLMVRGVPMRYRPPEGSIVITATRVGYLVIDGMHVSIAATNEQGVLAAAHALRPLSAGSDAGG
jgi:hypothetical protein